MYFSVVKRKLITEFCLWLQMGCLVLQEVCALTAAHWVCLGDRWWEYERALVKKSERIILLLGLSITV